MELVDITNRHHSTGSPLSLIQMCVFILLVPFFPVNASKHFSLSVVKRSMSMPLLKFGHNVNYRTLLRTFNFL